MSSSTLTSSVINKSGKTVAPKAVARRRQPPSRPVTSAHAEKATSVDENATESTGIAPDAQSIQQPSSAPIPPTTSQQSATQSQVETPIIPQPAAPLQDQPQDTIPAAQAFPTRSIEEQQRSTPADDITTPQLEGSAADGQQVAASPTIAVSPSRPAISSTNVTTTESASVAQPPTEGTSTTTPTTSDAATTLLNGVAQPEGEGRDQAQQVAGVKRKREAPKKAAPRTAPRQKEPAAQQSSSTNSQPLARQSIEIAEPDVQTTQAEKDIERRRQKNKKAAATREANREAKKAAASAASAAAAASETEGTTNRPKKATQNRKAKSAARVAPDDDGEGEAIANDDEAATNGVEPAVKKPKKKKRKRQAGAEGAEGQEGEQQEEDKSDPELHEIDPNAVTMFELARSTHYGKTSEREAKMATIDWAEVARKRRESPPTGPPAEGTVAEGETDGTPADGEARDPSQAPTPRAPPPRPAGARLRMVNGQLQIDDASLQVDRQAQAAADAANLEIVEDNDLTKRVNRMTWINDKRRDATERVSVYKMKSDPWNDDETDRFYDALRMFGTDFFIISKMFPPKTRRQIKLKFIREERLDPPRINAALAGQGVPMDLGVYAEATGQALETFKDPREIEAEMERDGEKERADIELKRQETAKNLKSRELTEAHKEREREAREAKKQADKEERAAIRARKRRGQFGTGTF